LSKALAAMSGPQRNTFWSHQLGLTIGTIALLASYVLLEQYVFRFQRVTRSLKRQIAGGPNSDVQIALTPGWVGALV